MSQLGDRVSEYQCPFGQVDVKMLAEQEFFGMKMAKLFSGDPANTGLVRILHTSMQFIYPRPLKGAGGSEEPNWPARHSNRYQQVVIVSCKVLHEDQMFQYPLSWNASADLKKAPARALFHFLSCI